MAHSRLHYLLVAFCLSFGLLMSAAAQTRTWTGGAGDGDWANDLNWIGGAPGAGESALITNGTVTLSADSAALTSVTVSNATLVFTNWATTLQATTVTIKNNGVFDLPDGFTDSGTSNRIHVACTDFTVDVGGLINADEGGFLASYGPGAGSTVIDRSRGGGYGGRGGMGSNSDDTGYAYGDVSAPLQCGSGGGSLGKGGTGGGAVWIAAIGTVTIEGTISANGSYRLANYGGGGSGGGVYIDCDTIAGTGLVSVNGGGANNNLGGRGSGGRIAIKYNDAGASWPGLRFQASMGSTGNNPPDPYTGKPGTVWFSDMTILTDRMGGNLLTDVVTHFGSGSTWAETSLTVSNSSFSIGMTGFVVNVSGNVLVDSGGDFGVANLNCGDSVLITNGGVLRIQSDPTNVVGGAYGALLAVTNNIGVGPSSTLWLRSHGSDGGSPLVRVENLAVANGGVISGDGYGYKGAAGPGAGDVGQRTAGGGHGGKGGTGDFLSKEGRPNGQAAPPIGPGSGGCQLERGGYGGSLIRIIARHTVALHGTISADGSRYGSTHGGGGAGGGVHVSCVTLDGSDSGLISADGGSGTANAGGGGGGRIALIYQNASPWPGIKFTTSPASGYASGGGVFPFTSDQGSLYLSDASALGTVLNGDRFTDVTLFVSNVTSWNVGSLSVSNCAFRFGLTNFSLRVTNDLVVGAGGYLGIVGLECHSNVIVTNGGELEVFANATNGTGRDFGAVVVVSNDLAIGGSSWVYVRSHEEDGGSPKFEVDRVLVAESGGISGDARGYEGAAGPGQGDDLSRRRGGGYGGQGGDGDQGGVAGLIYGSTNAPAQPGSGGCYLIADALMNQGGHGGGLIYVNAIGAVTVDGTLTANGGRYNVNHGGGGSGGGIFLLCDTFEGGVNAVVQANGGLGNTGVAGGGGGGRIAIAIGLSDAERALLASNAPVPGLTVFPSHAEYLGQLNVTGGLGRTLSAPASTGDEGTKRFMSTALALTVQGNPANYGSPLPDAYGTAADKSAGDVITNTVVSPANEAAGQRWINLGWQLTNVTATISSNIVASTQAVFELNENLYLTWRWTNQWELDVSAGPNGNVNSGAVNGWYTNADQVVGIDPTADPTYFFSQWVGDVPAGKENDDPLTVTMDQARTIQASFASLSGETKYWNGSGTWETAGNWSPAGLPSKFDSVVITNGSVVFGVSRDVRNLVVSNGAEMVFTNWNAVLTVSNDVLVAGTITLPGAFTDSGMSNRIQIVCSNFTVAAGGVIDADGAGFAGDYGAGVGTGADGSRAGGGSHGGIGGWGSVASALPGSIYDLTNAPVLPGSGGGSTDSGAGGGVVRVDAQNTVTVDGTVSSKGAKGLTTPGQPGGGSGGAIWISCATIGGSGGLIRAGGGDAGVLAHGGGGGGGRIAVTYDSAGTPNDVNFDVGPGIGWANSAIDTYGVERAAANGSLYLSDDSYLVSPLSDSQFAGTDLYISNVTTWAVADLVVSNCSVRFADDAFTITVGNNVRIGAGGELGVPWINCSGNLVVTNGGILSMYAGPTNGGSLAYGSLLDVAGSVAIGPASWVYAYCDENDGGAPKLEVNALYVGANAGIIASGRGFAADTGPGQGSGGNAGRAGGGGYGGEGGEGSSTGDAGGLPYGVTNAPGWAGSGGGYYDGGAGGGVIWVQADDVVTVDGTLGADGRAGVDLSGGGSGGSIWIDCYRFSGGSDGLLTAAGGSAGEHGGSGGGGRIAVWWGLAEGARQALLSDPDNPNAVPRLSVTNEPVAGFDGIVTATNGSTGFDVGTPGTIVFLNVPPPAGTIIMVR